MQTNDQVITEFNAVVRDVLNNDTLELNCQTKFEDVPEWDSLHHVEIIVAAEKRFKIRFNFAELQEFRTVGEICNNIAAKVATAPLK